MNARAIARNMERTKDQATTNAQGAMLFFCSFPLRDRLTLAASIIARGHRTERHALYLLALLIGMLAVTGLAAVAGFVAGAL